MEMPRPLPEHARLAQFAGRWQGNETLHPAPPFRPQASLATGEFHLRMDLDGYFLVSDYAESQAGRVVYRGHGVYGFDPREKTFTMHWFDSMGGVPAQVIRGTFEGPRLEFAAELPGFRSRYVYTVLSKDEFTFGIDMDRGAGWQPFMEGRYRRVG